MAIDRYAIPLGVRKELLRALKALVAARGKDGPPLPDTLAETLALPSLDLDPTLKAQLVDCFQIGFWRGPPDPPPPPMNREVKQS